MSAIIDFYKGDGTDHAGRTLDDVLKLSDGEVEHGHDFIQWLFPLPEASNHFPDAPLLAQEDIEALSTDERLRWRVMSAATMMASFYDRSPQWITPNNHNFLRITRIIRFLTLIGASAMASSFHAMILDLIKPHEGVVTDQTLWFWKEALRQAPAWL